MLDKKRNINLSGSLQKVKTFSNNFFSSSEEQALKKKATRIRREL